MGKIFEEKADQIVQRRKAFEAPLDGSKTRCNHLTRVFSGSKPIKTFPNGASGGRIQPVFGWHHFPLSPFQYN